MQPEREREEVWMQQRGAGLTLTQEGCVRNDTLRQSMGLAALEEAMGAARKAGRAMNLRCLTYPAVRAAELEQVFGVRGRTKIWRPEPVNFFYLSAILHFQGLFLIILINLFGWNFFYFGYFLFFSGRTDKIAGDPRTPNSCSNSGALTKLS